VEACEAWGRRQSMLIQHSCTWSVCFASSSVHTVFLVSARYAWGWAEPTEQMIENSLATKSYNL